MQLDLKVYLKRALKPHQRALLSIQRDYIPTQLNDDDSSNGSGDEGEPSKKMWSSNSINKLVNSLADFAPRSQFDRNLFMGALVRTEQQKHVEKDLQR